MAAADEAVLEEFPENEHVCRWIRPAREKVTVQGLPSLLCLFGHEERAGLCARFNDMVAKGTVSASIVIGRDHLDAGSVASPHRETESMAADKLGHTHDRQAGARAVRPRRSAAAGGSLTAVWPARRTLGVLA